MFDIQANVKALPALPGVYLMKNDEGNIIYVGKAKSLKNRVSSYFRKLADHTPKVRSMVAQIKEFEYIITKTELEALVLECNLIKKHKPKYNILLKDDKHYPFIKLTINEDYPKLFIVRKIEKDGAKYFGPYLRGFVARETIEMLKKTFKIATCKRKFPQDIGKGRPCLNYYIGQCVGVCRGGVAKDEYRAVFSEVITFLSGKHDGLIATMEAQMTAASQNLEFERAARLRDRINGIKMLEERQKIISTSQEDRDIIAMSKEDDTACVQVFFIRQGKILGRDNFVINDIAFDSESEILGDFVKQFYNDNDNIPKEVVLENNIDEASIISSWLTTKRGTKVTVTIPQKGEKAQLVEMAKQNAVEAIRNIARENGENNAALLEIKKILELDRYPRRIESYDISNTQGSESVASMVVFDNGKPKKSDYRKFKIKRDGSPDDYDSMREVIYRRLSHARKELELIRLGQLSHEKSKFSLLPDLILLDGGKGHVNVIRALVNEMEFNIPVFGIVKDSRHQTRGFSDNKQDIECDRRSAAFMLAVQIQNEVHRTAISFHRDLRQKRSVASELDGIAGVGPARRTALLNHFKSTKAIRQASLEQIEQASGIDKGTARKAYDYFNK